MALHSNLNTAYEHNVTETKQCVGFARNWLEANKGVTFSQVNYAFEIWESIYSYKRLIDGVVLKVDNRINGSRYFPEMGDLIIYQKNFFGTGHVAVVKSINKSTNLIDVVEQNYKEQYQSPKQQRKIKFLMKGERCCLQEPHILGWKHCK